VSVGEGPAVLSASRVLDEVVAALRGVIAPAIADPYPKAQAYMTAVILEYVARQVEDRHDLEAEKARALEALFRELPAALGGTSLEIEVSAGHRDHPGKPGPNDPDQEARLCRVIEWLYAERERLGPEVFAVANGRIRQTLRQLLNQDLKVAGKERD
jgi:hypothetical protein